MEGIFFRNHFTKHGLFLSFWVFCWLDLACAWCHNLLPHTITNSLKKVFIFISKVPRNGRKSHEMSEVVFWTHSWWIKGFILLFLSPFQDLKPYCEHATIIANMQTSQNCGSEVFLMFLIENGKKNWKRVNHFYQDHNIWFFLIKDFHFSIQIGRNLQKNSNMD